jgi:L-ascorbate metabolism protein UlaG (beta-lactamase superfamily)
METKTILWLLAGLSIVALILGGLALRRSFMRPVLFEGIEEKVAGLDKKIETVKRGLPPLFGGWPANGYMIKIEDGPTIYFSGDTGMMLNWEVIREYYKPDIVIATHSVLYQMGVNEWVYVINKIKPKYVLASHHGSFGFYPETDDDFVEAINEKTEATGVKLPEPGTEVELMGVKITWLGHSCFIIETPQGSRIALDPEWNAINLEDFPKEFKNPEKFAADLILISHGHFDHFDPKALEILLSPIENRTPHLIALFELAAYAKGILPEHAERILPLNLGVWIDKEILKAAYGVEMTHLDDVEIAGIAATHSSGVFSPIK